MEQEGGKRNGKERSGLGSFFVEADALDVLDDSGLALKVELTHAEIHL